jgi:phosphoglycolate phosphatase
MSFSHYDLVLYDIDGTLVDTGGAGMAALKKAALIFFGDHGPELDLAGSTDLGIVENMFQHFSRSINNNEALQFFTIYHELLESNLRANKFLGCVLPNVHENLVSAKRSGCYIGLLTGNTQRGATIKMKHYELDSHFSFGAFGDDFSDRNLLGFLAVKRATEFYQREFSPEKILVIGDTPKDITCAKAMNADCLAVATGKFSLKELQQYKPTFVVQTLAKFF